MKTLDQIIRYTSQCRFPDDDWQKVLAYCRERFKGGKIHKALSPISESSYDQFVNWLIQDSVPGIWSAMVKQWG